MNPENNIIKISCAECFTHGKIAQEIHAFSRGYPGNYQWNKNSSQIKISLTGGVFTPTLTGVESLLKIKPLESIVDMDDIKVYGQNEDIIMAERMAQAVQKITGSDMGIGTSAGIGKGGIAVCNKKIMISGTAEVFADLRTSSTDLIMRRQQSGIKKALLFVESLIENGAELFSSRNTKITYR